MASASLNHIEMGPPAHPNEVDRKRIERALKSRQRYRYVTPRVVAVPSGYRVESPCCSRNIDANGGIVDVALVLYDDDRVRWQLFRKDHKQAIWDLDNSYGGLDELLERLNADPERKFWQ